MEDEECELAEKCKDEAMEADTKEKKENASKPTGAMWEGVLAVLDDNLDWRKKKELFFSVKKN